MKWWCVMSDCNTIILLDFEWNLRCYFFFYWENIWISCWFCYSGLMWRTFSFKKKAKINCNYWVILSYPEKLPVALNRCGTSADCGSCCCSETIENPFEAECCFTKSRHILSLQNVLNLKAVGDTTGLLFLWRGE